MIRSAVHWVNLFLSSIEKLITSSSSSYLSACVLEQLFHLLDMGTPDS